MKIKQKLLLQAVLLALIPATIIAIAITWQANQSSFSALEEKAKEQLISLRELKKSQIDDYLKQVSGQVSTLAKNPTVKDAATSYIDAFNQQLISSIELNTAETTLQQYYQNEFTPTFDSKNSEQANTKEKFSQLSNKAKYYQARYIADNQFELGNKDKLLTAGDSAYDQSHQQYHPMFSEYLQQFGYYDIFIVDAQSGHIVYSVFKELDYATSLKSGPYANSGIAKAFNKALTLSGDNTSSLVDFEGYYPSYNQPASFIASPIKDNNGVTSAILIFQMPIDGINKIMTNNNQWQQVGLGLSGETYLVGSDNKLRSESRFLIEDKKNYYKALAAASHQPNLDKIKGYASAIGLQFVETLGTQRALSGSADFAQFSDYRGVEVLSAYTPIKYGELTWALMAEIDVSEAFTAATKLSSNLLFYCLIILAITALFSIIIGLISTNKLVQPINSLVASITNIAQGDGDLTAKLDIAKRSDEIGDIGKAFNQFVSKIRHIIIDIDHHAVQLASSSEELSAVTLESNNIVILQKRKTEQTSHAMSEFNDSINEIADNSLHTAELTNEANGESLKVADLSANAHLAINGLGDSVSSAAKELEQLNSQVEDISSVLSVIDNIAEQTNLLALNAAIEAARAGESGRGFSVVADEVRTLAGKTQESTIEIQEKIKRLKASSSQSVAAMKNASDEANKGIKLVMETARSLKNISALVSNVSSKNSANATVAKQQSVSVNQVHQNIIDIAEFTDSSSSAAQQTSQASEELAKLAVNMSNIVQQFKY
ncbi:methyl-accepting chemotaxis protein [Colwellia psychrerythraea]|uniref:Methyl-accepting chemotaxis sensory transducer n=1 Tax=Colwellia psychrerythraea TaxID=28229 RepID=A0A099L2Q8_COLPS|nr:methyl-accepting chemotaxis protein [Colwellia psychrerythraea]KGJ96133.1 methyl-accepting chemotaxis sensory transducer [Colwellia psychrerythraea]